MRESFNKSLKNSLLYLIKACEEVLDENNFYKLQEKINNLDCSLKLSSFLSAIHSKFYNGVKEKNLSKIVYLSEEILRKNFFVDSINYINLSTIDSFYGDFIRKVCSAEVERHKEYYVLEKEDFEHAKDKIAEGFNFLKLHFNNFYEEANDLISEILILNAQGIQAGTSVDLFGMVHKNHTYQMDKLTDIIDFIVHEQSHLYLHLIIKNDPLILNPLERHESPLRKEPRPLIGIYHATFVLSRIIHVLKTSLEKNLLPITEQEYCLDLINHYLKRFDVGYSVLNQHAQMTNYGLKILSAMQNLVYFSTSYS